MNENVFGNLDLASAIEVLKTHYQMAKDAIEDLGSRYAKTKSKVKRTDYSKRLLSWLVSIEGAGAILFAITGDRIYLDEPEKIFTTLEERLES